MIGTYVDSLVDHIVEVERLLALYSTSERLYAHVYSAFRSLGEAKAAIVLMRSSEQEED